MACPGLCVFAMQLPSQPGPDTSLENGRVQHGISSVGRGNMTSESFELSDASYDASNQEGLCVEFPDLAQLASKGSFSRESSRSSFWSSYSSTLSAVSEDGPWECSMHDDKIQDERCSLSSLSSSDESISCNGKEVSAFQSSYKGPLANMLSLKEALPCKRGLSAFFTGKSRSFSSLSNVASVEDLAKYDNPYSKKRKYSACIDHADRSMRTEAVGSPKKSSHGSKHKNAISATPGANEQDEYEQFNYPLRIKKTPRSYSLSDLRCAGSQFSPD